MRYDNPAHREMMDLEGLKAWLPGRTTGYAALADAVRETGVLRARRACEPAAVSGHDGRQLAAAAGAAARVLAEASPRARPAASSTASPIARCSRRCARRKQAGADLVTDGEQRRDNFYSFVAEKLDGVQMMTLAEMLDVVEDKQGFARLLETLDVPGLFDPQPDLRRARSAAASRWRSTTSSFCAGTPIGRSR